MSAPSHEDTRTVVLENLPALIQLGAQLFSSPAPQGANPADSLLRATEHIFPARRRSRDEASSASASGDESSQGGGESVGAGASGSDVPEVKRDDVAARVVPPETREEHRAAVWPLVKQTATDIRIPITCLKQKIVDYGVPSRAVDALDRKSIIQFWLTLFGDGTEEELVVAGFTHPEPGTDPMFESFVCAVTFEIERVWWITDYGDPISNAALSNLRRSGRTLKHPVTRRPIRKVFLNNEKAILLRQWAETHYPDLLDPSMGGGVPLVVNGCTEMQVKPSHSETFTDYWELLRKRGGVRVSDSVPVAHSRLAACGDEARAEAGGASGGGGAPDADLEVPHCPDAAGGAGGVPNRPDGTAPGSAGD